MKNVKIEYRQLFNFTCAVIAVMVILILLAYLAFAGEDEWQPVDEWVEENYDNLPDSIKEVVPKPAVADGQSSTQIEGEWYGRLLQLHDLHGVGAWQAEIKIKPHQSDFPLTKTTNLVTQDSIIIPIVIRDIYPPYRDKEWGRPHIEVEAERRRFDEAIDYVWKIISASDYFIVKNPKWHEDLCIVDVYITIAGIRINFADALIEAGHASDNPNVDWGKRNP